MTFGEFKELGFPDIMPMENVLAQALFDRKIDVSEVLNAYYRALEAERHKLTSQFEEACVCLNMHLSKSWKGENRKKLEKDDLALTWEDIAKIDAIILDVNNEFAVDYTREINRQKFYEEVLKRFKEDKK